MKKEQLPKEAFDSDIKQIKMHLTVIQNLEKTLKKQQLLLSHHLLDYEKKRYEKKYKQKKHQYKKQFGETYKM